MWNLTNSFEQLRRFQWIAHYVDGNFSAKSRLKLPGIFRLVSVDFYLTPLRCETASSILFITGTPNKSERDCSIQIVFIYDRRIFLVLFHRCHSTLFENNRTREFVEPEFTSTSFKLEWHFETAFFNWEIAVFDEGFLYPISRDWKKRFSIIARDRWLNSLKKSPIILLRFDSTFCALIHELQGDR